MVSPGLLCLLGVDFRKEMTAIQLWTWVPPMGHFPESLNTWSPALTWISCLLQFPWLPSGGISSFGVVGWLHNAGTQQAPWVWEWETLHFVIRNAHVGLNFLVLSRMRGGTCMVAGTCHPAFERLRKKDGEFKVSLSHTERLTKRKRKKKIKGRESWDCSSLGGVLA